MSASVGTLYLLRMGLTDYYKIGWTGQEVQTRITALQTGNPYQLILIAWWAGTLDDEQEWHRRLWTWHVQGGGEEWFTLGAQTIQEIVMTPLALKCRSF